MLWTHQISLYCVAGTLRCEELFLVKSTVGEYMMAILDYFYTHIYIFVYRDIFDNMSGNLLLNSCMCICSDIKQIVRQDNEHKSRVHGRTCLIKKNCDEN